MSMAQTWFGFGDLHFAAILADLAHLAPAGRAQAGPAHASAPRPTDEQARFGLGVPGSGTPHPCPGEVPPVTAVAGHRAVSPSRTRPARGSTVSVAGRGH